MSSSNISKTPFLEDLCTMVSLSSIEKDSIATTRDSFKDYILACKIRNQMYTNFEKRKVPQTVSGNIPQNSCSVRHTFCTIFVLLSVAKVLEKHFRSSSYLVLIFFKENSHSRGKFTKRQFLLQLLYTKFIESIFFRIPISDW